MKTAALALLLAGCTTTTAHLAAKEPFEVVHSHQARTVVADCLLNRITSDDLMPTREIGTGITILTFNGRGLARQPAIYNFVIRDEPTGSLIEVRRYAGSSVAVAETCFS